MLCQAPNRTSPFHREHDQGILSGFFMGSLFLGVKKKSKIKTPAFNNKFIVITKI